jgi:L-lactate dehydrogenase complex protein LldF
VTTTFHDRVETALADDRLRVALGRTLDVLGSRRASAFATLPDSDHIRDRARHAKLETLRSLRSHLLQFEDRARANGAHVHWADSAADANRIVIAIAREHDVRRVVKGKSMVSEETHLNAALEQTGLTVVETDLGEYIVQLAGDRPSHIVAPIIHMSRAAVGQVMHDTLNVPLSDDPATLAGYARARLRAEFLAADMGITGANFGVAENGTICLVTNEGNGRMVTTLPRVHVVLMGIEKLVPTMADLGRFLQILARSSTGQQLTAYTTLLRGPRRPGDECGPQEMHIVLLDNGRSRMLAGDLAEILGCIRCGACMNACPVYRSVGGHAYGDTYPGPVGAVLTPGLRGLSGWSDLPSASSLCGACRDVCPIRLDIPRMLLSLRHRTVEEEPTPATLRVGMAIFGWIASRPRLYRAATRVARIVLRRAAPDGWLRRAPGLAAGWTAVRDLRTPAPVSFQEEWRARQKIRVASVPAVASVER